MAENMNELIKQIAMAAFEESKPTAIVYGVVTGTHPLEITIDQKLRLSKEYLILTNAVCDHEVFMTVNHTTESIALNADHNHKATASFDGDISITIKNEVEPDTTKVESIATADMNGDVKVEVEKAHIPLDHAHGYSGKKKFIVHNNLLKGEKVILLRVQSGQKYLVLDRVVV